jgi:tetratricopeptide (TPR) repeat protein
MKKSTGIILRLVIVLAIVGVFVGVLWGILKWTAPNPFKLTDLGKASLAAAEKAYDNGDPGTGKTELDKAKEYFRRAIKADTKYFVAHYYLGKSYMLEAEKGGGEGEAREDALTEADKSFDEVMRLGATGYLPALVDRCRIWDRYHPVPGNVRTVAQMGIDYYNNQPLDPTKSDYATNRDYLVQLHFYLAKSTRIIAMSNLVTLLYVTGETLPEQDRKFRYAEAALDFQKSAASYQALADAVGAATLPQDVTPAQIYMNLGEAQLHLLECYWPIYVDASGKELKPPVDFSQLTPAEAPKRKEVFFTLGLLLDKEANVFKPLSTIRQEIAAKTTDAKPNTPLDPKTTNYFDMARRSAEEAAKTASGPDAEKAKADLEKTLMRIGQIMVVYGIVPPDPPPTHERPGEIYLDTMRKAPAIAKSPDFYAQYAELLVSISKRSKALEVLQEGLTSLNSPVMLRLALGRFYTQENKYEEAREQFMAALSADNTGKDAHYELANLYITMAEQGRKDYLNGAQEHVDWLVNSNPDETQYTLLQGRLYMQLSEQADKAKELFERVHQMSGGAKIQGAYWLGLYYRVQNDPDSAVLYLTEAKDLLGSNPNVSVYFSLVSILMGRNNEKALALCVEYEQYSKEQRKPVEDEMLRSKAECQAALGLKEEAKNTYRELAARPGNIAAAVEAAYMLLGGFTNPEYIRQAEQIFKQVIEAEKDLPPLKKNLGAYYGRVKCIFMRDQPNTKDALKVLEEMKPIAEGLNKAIESGTADEIQDAKNKYRHYQAELYDVYEKETPLNTKMLDDIVKEMVRVDPNSPETIDRQMRMLAGGLPPTGVTQLTKEQMEFMEAKLKDPSIEEKEKQNIRRDLAQRLLAAERFDDARTWFLEVLKGDDKDFAANHRLAEICITKGEYDNAAPYVKKLEETFPNNQQVKVLRALLESMRADGIDNRIAILVDAATKNPDISQLHYMLAQAYKDAARYAGQWGDVEGNLRNAINEYVAAYKKSGLPIGLAGEIAQARLNLGRVLLNARDVSNAKEEYRQCLEITEKLCETLPNNADFTRMRAECVGMLAKNEDEINKAIGYYETAKKAKLQQLSDAEADQKPEAVKTLKGDLFSIYLDLGQLYLKVGKKDLAEACSAQLPIYAIQPRDKATAYVSRAMLNEETKDYDGALKEYRDALANPEIAGDPNPDAHMPGDAAAHIDVYRQLTAYYGRREDAAASQQEKDDFYQQRLAILEEAQKKYPASPEILVTKAEAIYRHGDRATADNILTEAITNENKPEKKDKNPNLYVAVGLFRENQARTAEELREIEKLLKTGKDLARTQESFKARLLDFYIRHLDVFKDDAHKFVSDLKAKPPDKAIYIAYEARLAAGEGELDKAMDLYKQATEKEPTLETAYIEWRDVLLQKSPDKVDEAIQIIQNGQKYSDRSAALKNALGMLYVRKNNMPAAKALFDEVLNFNNKDFYALEGRAFVAADDLVNPDRPYPSAMADAQRAIRANLYSYYADNVVVQRLMGTLCLYEGDADGAVDHFKRAYSMGSDTISLVLLSHLTLDKQAVKVNYPGLKNWAMTVPRGKEDTDIQIFIGRCMMKNNEAGADAFFKAAAALTGDKWAAPYAFTDIYWLQRGREASANEAFEKCMPRLKNDAADIKTYVLSYIEAGYPARAIQLLERAAETADGNLRFRLDALRALICLFELNDAAKAEEIARKILEDAKDNAPPDALCVLGKILCDKGGDSFKEGLDYLDRAVAADPREARYYAAQAEAYYSAFKTGNVTTDRENAFTATGKAFRLDPSGFAIVPLYLQAGDIYSSMNDKKSEASDYYKRYLAFGGTERATELCVWLGDYYYGDKQYQEAIDAYNKALESGGIAPAERQAQIRDRVKDLYLQLGDQHANANRPKQASDAYTKYLGLGAKDRPTEQRLWLWFGDYYYGEKQLQEASDAYRKFFDLGGKAPAGRDAEIRSRIIP